MTLPLLLWIDLTCNGPEPSLPHALGSLCRVQICNDADTVQDQIETLQPSFLCYDTDTPSQSQRSLLQSLKLHYPSIPVLLLTSAHSTELIMWALRTRVWDCFIKPVHEIEFTRRVRVLISTLTPQRKQHARELFMPEPHKAHVYDNNAARTELAMRYLTSNFCERVPLADAAEICGMNIFEFSRTFKREHGMTFRDYTLQLRIQAAAHALCSTDTSILDVAFSVGFNDPSHFSRLFRRTMGVTPSMYRRKFVDTSKQND